MKYKDEIIDEPFLLFFLGAVSLMFTTVLLVTCVMDKGIKTTTA